MAQRDFVTHPLTVRRLEVIGVTDVTPHMRRVTLGGEQIRDFHRDGMDLPAFVSEGFDDHVKLIFATDGDVEPVLPIQHPYSIDWPAAPTRVMRDYTPRRYDPIAGELDLDFVRHGDGPAATWAEGAVVGDVVHTVGPKSSLVFPEDIDWVLLAGDETALPAIGRFFDERPVEVPVHAFIEVRHEQARQDLALRPDDEITWIDPSTSSLADAVSQVAWRAGSVYAWVAGESGALLPLRKWLSREKKVPKTHTNITGYWHARPAAEAPAPEAESAEIDLDDLVSPVPWLTVRAALELGVLDAVAVDAVGESTLAESLGVAHGRLGPLLDYLVAIEVLERNEAHTIALGRRGSAILDDEHLLESLTDTIEARALSSMIELASAIRDGESSYERFHAQSLAEEMATRAQRFEEMIEGSLGLDFVAGGVKELTSISEAATVVLTGAGAAAVAEAVDSDTPVVIVGDDVEQAALRERLRRSGQVEFSAEIPDASEVVIAANTLWPSTDRQAAELMTTFAGRTSRLIVIEEFGDPGTDAHGAEHRLVDLAITGSARRDIADVTALAEAAGWRAEGTTPLGWDYIALEFTR